MTAWDERLEAVLRGAAQGRAGALHLHGARGSGRSHVLGLAAEAAGAHGFLVVRAAGDAADRELAFAGLASLLGPLAGRFDAATAAALAPVLGFDASAGEGFAVKLAVFRFLSALAESQPVCIAVDDVDLVDAATVDVLAFVMRRAAADPWCLVTTATTAANPFHADAVPVPRATQVELVAMLTAAGVAEAAARACADAADGNPGLARALADGLPPDQRDGRRPVPATPRPAGVLADELQARLRAHGDRVCRALVVAAAEHEGDLGAIRAALASLGEPPGGLDDAETAGLLEVAGTRCVFTDPWTRAAAYHLVAPASRRAAHRALAAAFSAPHQAASRAWHLAAGADGPSDEVAEALVLLAADTARRGATTSAALTAERAAEFATTAGGRTAALLLALQWWLDGGSVDGVTRVRRCLDRSSAETAAAVDEADVFLHGEAAAELQATPAAAELPGDAVWQRRRARRREMAAAVVAGDHRAVVRSSGRHPVGAAELLALACAHRHAGRLREAWQGLDRLLALTGLAGSAIESSALLLEADLAALAGRVDDAAAALGRIRHPAPAAVRAGAAVIRARLQLVGDPALDPILQPEAFEDEAVGRLAEVRAAVRTGVLRRDSAALREAVALADGAALPVEAGEARLWLAAASSGAARDEAVSLAAATLQRCGARCWDRRLALLAAASAAEPPARDPAFGALSQAELRVAEAVARGLTNREVASTLLISVKTVDFHLQQMYRKLGVRSRTELAVRFTGTPTQGAAR